METPYSRIKTQFQPLYKYHCAAKVAVTLRQDQVFLAKHYTFTTLTVCTNAPIRVGDCLSKSCCDFKNDHVELLKHFNRKYFFNSYGVNLQYIYGLSVESLTHNFINPEDQHLYSTNGDIDGIVYLELSGHPDESQRNVELEDWKALIPEWDKLFEPCKPYQGLY